MRSLIKSRGTITILTIRKIRIDSNCHEPSDLVVLLSFYYEEINESSPFTCRNN